MSNGPSPADVGGGGPPINPYEFFARTAISVFGGSKSAASQVSSVARNYGFESPQYARVRAKFPRAAAQFEARWEAGKVRVGGVSPRERAVGKTPADLYGGARPGTPPIAGAAVLAGSIAVETPAQAAARETLRRAVEGAGRGVPPGREVIVRPDQARPPRLPPGTVTRVLARAGGLIGGLLYPSEITPEVPIPKRAPGPTTRGGARRPGPPPAGPVKAVPPGGSAPGRTPARPSAPVAVQNPLEPILRGPPGPVSVPVTRPIPTGPVGPGGAPGPAGTRPASRWPTWLPYLAPLLSRSLRTSSRGRRSSELGIGRTPTGVTDPLTGVTPGMQPFPQSGTPVGPGQGARRDCECNGTRKRRKKRKPRTECYYGTYTEKASGLVKRKKRKVTCK